MKAPSQPKVNRALGFAEPRKLAERCAAPAVAGSAGSGELSPGVRLAPLAPPQGAGRSTAAQAPPHSLRGWTRLSWRVSQLLSHGETFPLFIWAVGVKSVSECLCLAYTDVKTSSGK